MPEVYHLRVRCVSDEVNESVHRWCQKNTVKYFMMQELGCAEEKLHFHILIHSKISKHGLYQNFRKKFEGKLSGKNKDFCFKDAKSPQDVEQLAQYCCKGYLPWKQQKSDYKLYACSNDFTKEDFDEYHKCFWAYNDQLARERQVYNEPVKKKEKTKTFVQVCIDFIKKETPRRDFDPCFEPDQIYVLDVVLDHLGEMAKGLDDFIVRRHVYGIFNYFQKKDSQYRVNMHQRIFGSGTREY